MKRVRDICNDDEALSLVFNKLDRAARYKLICIHYANNEDAEVVVFTDGSLYRDLLPLIIAHIDVTTWGRMRLVCKTWHRHLKSYPLLVTLSLIDEKLNFFDTWKRSYDYIILFAARKLTLAVRKKFQNNNYPLPFYNPARPDPSYYDITPGVKVDTSYGFVHGQHASQRSICSVFSPNVLDFLTVDEKRSYVRVKYKYEMTLGQSNAYKRWSGSL